MTLAILVSLGQYNIDYRASPGDVMNGHPWGSRVKYGAKQEKLLKRRTRALFERFSFEMRARSKNGHVATFWTEMLQYFSRRGMDEMIVELKMKLRGVTRS